VEKKMSEVELRLDRFSMEDLKKEIERREKLVDLPPEPLGHPDFNPLLHMVAHAVKSIVATQSPGKGFKQYVFEAVLEGIYGEKIWPWWNKNAKYE
jgi:hypothetical protein